MFLDAFVELDGIFQCFVVTRGTSIFRQSINHETYGIELLLRVFRIAFVVEAPICASKFLIDEMLDDIFLGTGGCFEVFRLAEHTISGRERPQDACIEDSALVSRFHQFSFACHLTIETAVLLVLHLVEPETENVVFKYVENLGFQNFDSVHFYFLIGYL